MSRDGLVVAVVSGDKGVGVPERDRHKPHHLSPLFGGRLVPVCGGVRGSDCFCRRLLREELRGSLVFSISFWYAPTTALFNLSCIALLMGYAVS